MDQYIYLILVCVPLAIPIIFFIRRKTSSLLSFKPAFISIVLSALIIIPIDLGLTAMGIWNYNKSKILGIYWGQLPIENIIFTITSLFICVYMYEYLKTIMNRNYLRKIHFYITPLLIISLIILLINNVEKTFTALCSAAFILLLCIQLINGKRYMAWYYKAYFICLLPFLFCQIILTSLSIVIINKSAFLNLQLINMPIDFLIYFGAILLLLILIYEWLNRITTSN